MKFVIKTFNPLFWILNILTIILAYLYKLFFINFGEDKTKILFGVIYIFMFIYYFYYKIKLANDKEYDEFCEKMNLPKSNLLSEIFPLQLCNVAYILVPIGILFDNSACIGFGLLLAPICALTSLLMPYPGLSDDSLLKPRISGFYFTHLFILFMSLITWMTKTYDLNYELAFEVFVLMVIASAVAHIVNRILYNTGLCKDANYFFTMNADVSDITKFFYKLIPIKWIYEFPIFLMIWMFFNIVVFVVNLF